MDLKQAFGRDFTFTYKTDPLFQPPEALGNTVTKLVPDVPVTPITRHPEIYLLQVQIGRDDCHLVCMFLFVFIISFLLSRRSS